MSKIGRIGYDRLGPVFNSPIIDEAATAGATFTTVTIGAEQYRCAKFTTTGPSGSLSVTKEGPAEVLLVGGGGKGGDSGPGWTAGGGGAGGLVILPYYLAAGNISVTVAAERGYSTIGPSNGLVLRAGPGGNGGNSNGNGLAGICGGSSGGRGGQGGTVASPVGVTTGYSAMYTTTSYNGNLGGSTAGAGWGTGGGGAGGPGGNGTDSPINGPGGAGVTVSNWDSAPLTLCAGGNSGTGGAATPNTGNGGHGWYANPNYTGQVGANGLVIVRWRIK